MITLRLQRSGKNLWEPNKDTNIKHTSRSEMMIKDCVLRVMMPLLWFLVHNIFKINPQVSLCCSVSPGVVKSIPIINYLPSYCPVVSNANHEPYQFDLNKVSKELEEDQISEQVIKLQQLKKIRESNKRIFEQGNTSLFWVPEDSTLSDLQNSGRTPGSPIDLS